MKSKAPVFRDDKGNRMLFPGYIYGPDDDAPINFWSIGMSISAATGLTMEDDWIEFDADQFPHIKTSAGSAGFLHGSEDVILFDGPEFQAATV